MLPDLPSYKADIHRLLMLYFQRQVNANLGVFQQAGRRTAYEGNKMRIVRGDGTTEESEYQRASTQLTLKFEEIANLTLPERLHLLQEMANDMANQMSSAMFQSLNKTLEEAG